MPSTPGSNHTASSARTYNGEAGPARLHPWDSRLRLQAQASTDQSLRYHAGPTNDLEREIMRQAGEESWISHEAKGKRTFAFYIMVLLSILPFFSLLVHYGVFDSALSWYTHGEVGSLTPRQKRFIFMEMVFVCVAWPTVIVLLVAHFISQTHNNSGSGGF